MKKMNFLSTAALLLAAVAFTFTGCKDKHVETRTFTGNSPVYMPYEQMRNIKMEEPRNFDVPGKLYVYNDYLLINDVYTGIHVFDNSNPANPINIGFINVPGNVDIAVKDNILYVDNYTDLVAVDITDINNIHVRGRVDGAFPYSVPPYDESMPVATIDQSKGVVIDWEIKEVTETCMNGDCGNYQSNAYTFGVNDRAVASEASVSGSAGFASGNKSTASGIAGSMARFMVVKDYLYSIVDNSNVKLFDISTPGSPSYANTTTIGTGIETLFLYGENLFVGSESGMFIYSVENPASPQEISTFAHAQGCDPVVVTDDYAYVTIRSGGGCGGWESQLNVIDVKDLTNPLLIRSVIMDEPYGVGADGEKQVVFVCDGNSGLKAFNIAELIDGESEDAVAPIKTIYNNSFDVIAMNGQLIMVGDDGFYQYDYSDITNIQKFGTILF